MTGSLIVVTGPSGVGKGTVLKRVFEEIDDIVYSISATTRHRRPDEIDGKHYLFKTRSQFEAMISAREFLEWAEFVGNYYGTPKSHVTEMLNSNKDVILEIEMEGAKQIKQSMPAATFIFIAPPSLASLRRRLEERGTETPEKIELRVQKAQQELSEADWFDYHFVNEDSGVANTADLIIQLIKKIRSIKNSQS